MQTCLVTDYLKRFLRKFHIPAVIWACSVGIADRVHDDAGKIYWLLLQFAPLIQTGKQEKILHEAGHSGCFRLDAVERVANVIRKFSTPATSEFGIAANRGEWGAEFAQESVLKVEDAEWQ